MQRTRQAGGTSFQSGRIRRASLSKLYLIAKLSELALFEIPNALLGIRGAGQVVYVDGKLVLANLALRVEYCGHETESRRQRYVELPCLDR
jgi:hypothetical protein